jgi:hypothetical protein
VKKKMKCVNDSPKSAAKDVLLVSRDPCGSHRMLWLCVTLLFICQAAVLTYLSQAEHNQLPAVNCSCTAHELPPLTQSATSGLLSRSRRHQKDEPATGGHKSGKQTIKVNIFVSSVTLT